MSSWASGCSSDDSESDDAGFDGVYIPVDVSQEGPDYCDIDAFDSVDGNGGACSPIAPDKPCFVECEAGGCSCVAGPKGTGIWQCTVDTSCLPKCAPEDPDCGLDGSMFADTGPFDTGLDEEASDAGSDADAGAVDASHDASGDASLDGHDGG